MTGIEMCKHNNCQLMEALNRPKKMSTLFSITDVTTLDKYPLLFTFHQLRTFATPER